jgi:tetratricopeptide (TPR) repeat protein
LGAKVSNKETNMWLLNRGICNKYLGKIENAYQDLKQVAEIEKDDFFTQRQYLFLIHDSGKIEEAIQKAKQLYLDYPQEHELLIIRCQFYIGTSNLELSYIDECITDLEKAISLNPEQKLLASLYHFLSFFLIEKNDKNLILDLVNRLQEHLTDILICIDLLKLYTFLGDKNNYNKYVPITLQLLNEKVEVRNIIMLFDDLRVNGYHKEAIQVIENCDILSQNTDLNCWLVQSHIQLKNYDKALLICERVRNIYGVDAKTYLYEVSIYEKIGEFDKAASLAEIFIRSQIDTFQKLPIIIRLGYKYLVKSQIDKLNNIIPLLEQEWKENYNLEMPVLFELASIYIFIGNINKGLEIAYKTRNLYATVNNAHFEYILICKECYGKTELEGMYAEANLESIYFLEDNDTRVSLMSITPRGNELTYEILWECFEKSNFDINKPPFCNRVRYLGYIDRQRAVYIAIKFIKQIYLNKTNYESIDIVLRNLLANASKLQFKDLSDFYNLIEMTISLEFKLFIDREKEDLLKRLSFYISPLSL